MKPVKGEIHDLFSSIARTYDRLNTVLSFGSDKIWRKRGVSYLQDRRAVLDICAGTLPLTKELLGVNSQVSVTAIDFSQPMIDWGLEHLPKEMASRVTAECSDFFKFIRPPGSFDGAMCAYGMRNLDDNQEALTKIHQLLKTGGRLVILEFFRPDRWYTWFFHYTYAQFMIPIIGWLVSGNKGAYRYLRDSVRGFYTLDQYTALLNKSGFKVIKAKRMTGGISSLIVADKI
jgi:demethylmenaquinone methyltransferase / 2-methoxy-6-polyprenyl-1,4-benzoquinol methylase